MDRRLALFTLAGALPAAALITSGRVEAQAVASDPRMAALMGGEFSLQSSQLAQERSRNARIRQFAELEAAEQAAYAVAMGGAPGSVQLRPDHAQMLQQMSQLNGAAFDRMYLRGQMTGHQELLQLNQAMSRGGGDQVTRSVSTLAVPAIQTHMVLLQMMNGGRARSRDS